MSNFHVGQKVVCINGSFEEGAFYDSTTLPSEGKIYTVRDVFEPVPEALCLRLVEVVNEAQDFECGFMEAGFRDYRFRPVVIRPTSIEIFTAMLNKPTVRVDA